MKLRKGNLHIAEIKRNSKIMEDASTEIIEHRCIEWNIVKKIVPITKPHFVYWHLNNKFTCKCKTYIVPFCSICLCSSPARWVHKSIGCNYHPWGNSLQLCTAFRYVHRL